jgi:mono/diheme cytochrome c family protein
MTRTRTVGWFLRTSTVYSWTGNTRYVEAKPEGKSSMRRKAVVLAFVSFAFAVTAQGEAPYGQPDYVRYCSACHGEFADGKGPVANVLTPSPPALTRLRAKYGRPLGTSLVAYVMGDSMPRAHGTSDMPVWGRNLKEADGEDANPVRTIWRITTYLESIQGATP